MSEPAPPFRIQQLDHIVLRTANLPGLRDFYVGLGAAVVRDKLDEFGLLQLRIGASILDLVDVSGRLGQRGGAAPDREARNLDHFAVRVEPYDEASILTFCAAHDIPARAMPSPIFGADGFGPAVYIEDPDGNVMELKGPPVDLEG